jgi:hypothetical protein
MSDTAHPGRAGITVRLDKETRDRVQRIAADEHRSIAGYVQMLIERDLRAREQAERIVHVFTASELEGKPPGKLLRETGETDRRYTKRAETLRTLLGEH